MEANTEDRPQHPVYGKALSGATRTVDGVAFYPYRAGVCRYVRVSHDGRITVYDSGRTGSVYTCLIEGAGLPKAFRRFDTAARAGIAAAGRSVQHANLTLEKEEC